MKKIAFYTLLATLLLAFKTHGMQLPQNFTEVDRITQPDGKTFVVGTRNFDGKDTLVLARYNTNNELDAGFGNAGLSLLV